MPTKCIVDCSTGIQSYIEMTAEEVADREAGAAAALALHDQEVAAAEAAAAAKASGEAKLADLGLSADEIAALVG